MISFASGLQRKRITAQSKFAEIFRSQIKAFENKTLHCYIPRLRHLYEKHPKMPYHFKPELFVQLGGVTEFSFPGQHFTLKPGEVCVVPKGMPHGEIVRAGGEPFENVVVSYYNDMIEMHIAHEQSPGCPAADELHFFTTELFPDMVSYLDRICEFQHVNPEVNEVAIKALLLAEFSLLLTLVEKPNSHLPLSADLATACLWLIQHNLQDEGLSLKALAVELDCSPNYLSTLFHQKIGERIVERINRLRIQNAILALGSTRLSIKTIASACGYSDANYFTRIFRQVMGRSPQQHRQDMERLANAVEAKPWAEPAVREDDKLSDQHSDAIEAQQASLPLRTPRKIRKVSRASRR